MENHASMYIKININILAHVSNPIYYHQRTHLLQIQLFQESALGICVVYFIIFTFKMFDKVTNLVSQIWVPISLHEKKVFLTIIKYQTDIVSGQQRQIVCISLCLRIYSYIYSYTLYTITKTLARISKPERHLEQLSQST